MSFSFVTPCSEVLNSFVLLIEGNIEQPQMQVIEVHVAQCPACEEELAMHSLVQQVLRRTCNEEAPAELHHALFNQIHGQIAGAFTEVVTQFSMTEISIEIDEFGQVEHREVTIEHTEEIRYINEGDNPTT
jgi:mycothiol system anti-sigma-R factor